MSLRRPKELQGEINSHFGFIFDICKQLLNCSLCCLAKSLECLATTLSRKKFNLYFGGPSFPALGRLFHKGFQEFRGNDVAPVASAEQGVHISGKLENTQREIEANRDHIACRGVRELRQQHQNNIIVAFYIYLSQYSSSSNCQAEGQCKSHLANFCGAWEQVILAKR